MLCNEYFLIVDLVRDDDDELVRARQIIRDVLKKRKIDLLYNLYSRACAAGEALLGSAMMVAHHIPIEDLSIPGSPSVSELAYSIAESRIDVGVHEEVRHEILQNFDVIGFVFDHTDYNECDGRVFRRSG